MMIVLMMMMMIRETANLDGLIRRGPKHFSTRTGDGDDGDNDDDEHMGEFIMLLVDDVNADYGLDDENDWLASWQTHWSGWPSGASTDRFIDWTPFLLLGVV